MILAHPPSGERPVSKSTEPEQFFHACRRTSQAEMDGVQGVEELLWLRTPYPMGLWLLFGFRNLCG